jgi:glycosyltransferase involved in cell wall biosynthesis
MRILFLTQVLPYPLDAGPKARAYYVLRHLAQQHTVTLVSFVRTTDTPAAVAHLRQFCQAVYTVPMVRSRLKDGLFLLKSLVAGRPFIIERDWVDAMAKELAALVQQGAPYDAIHADQLWMAPYARWAQQQSNGARPRMVLDQHNAVFMIPQRMAESEPNPLKRVLLQLEARKLADFEVKTCRQFDHVTWVTAEDYAAVQARAAAQAPIPNDGVIPICGNPEEIAPIPVQPGARRVTFLGGLHYPPNAQGVLWFAREVFPHILAQQPGAVLTVLGKQPPAGLETLEIPAANLTITGYVDDPTPYLAETAAFIVPLLAGGGMRVKIIDGWTWGLPIVSTSIGAEGIAVQPGENILIADTPTDFAQAVLGLLQNPAAAAQLAQAGRDWVLQRYNWRTTYAEWDRVYS